MSDIPSDLRELAGYQDTSAPGDGCEDPDLLRQAASEIEKLQLLVALGEELAGEFARQTRAVANHTRTFCFDLLRNQALNFLETKQDMENS